MRKFFLVFIISATSVSVFAQGNSGGKGKSKNAPAVSNETHGKSDKEVGGKSKIKSDQHPDKAKNDEHDRKVWDGVSGGSDCGKSSKNQPAKVRSSFQRDYPNAINVRWTKCRGDWTATFGNGLFLSTAVYHANGDRRDTRTPVNQDNIPRRILDEILKKRPATRLEEAIKIEVPSMVKEIFRIKNVLEGKTQYEYYNADGVKVEYNY